MGITARDTKVLWSRSGNRCAFPECRIELIVGGDASVIGEMAHIVAQSEDGPRGDYDLPLDRRDEYSNLILLCPTHHTIIDRAPLEWPVLRLHQMKAAHERWVTEQLDAGRISVSPIDNSKFLVERQAAWLDFALNKIWCVASLTPLDAAEEVLELPSNCCARVLNEISVPGDALLAPNPRANPYNTRPSENGLINEEFRNINEGIGWSLEVFRNGHAEFLFSLDASSRQTTLCFGMGAENPLIYYKDLYSVVKSQVSNLLHLWRQCLPFSDALFSITLLNSLNSRLFSQKLGRGQDPIVGPAIRANVVTFSRVFNKDDSGDEILTFALQRLTNGFGLDLPSITDEKGKIALPIFYRR